MKTKYQDIGELQLVIMDPDFKALRDLFCKWQEGMQEKDPDSILAFYKKLVQLRKDNEIIADGEILICNYEEAGDSSVLKPFEARAIRG